MQRVLKLACLSALLSTTCLCSFAMAEPVSTLDTVTVVTTRTAQDTFDVPAMTSVINLDQPGLSGAVTPADMFRTQPWIAFGGTARGNGQTPTMRGYDADGIIVLLDGTRQNFESAHDGRFYLDPALIQSVEVVRGSQSALYGAGGLGGVIAFETKDAADLLAPGVSSGGMLNFGYASGNDARLVSGAAYGMHGAWDYLGSISTRASGDIELGDGNTLNADDSNISGLFKLGFLPAEHHRIEASVQHLSGDSIEPNNPQVGPGDSTAGQTVAKDISSTTAALSYAYNDPSQAWLNLHAKVYSTQTEVAERLLVNISPNLTGDVLVRALDTWGVNLGNQSRFSAGENITHTLSYGVEYYEDTQNGSDSRFGERGGVPDAQAQYFGAYIQDELVWALGAAGDLILIPAVRFDQYRSENASALENEDQAVSPKISLTYLPNDWFRLFANWGEAFRAPNLTEIYTTGTHFVIPGPGGGSNTFVPNPDLRPERAETFEVGFGLDWPGMPAGQRLKLKASYYETAAQDYIDTTVNFVPFPCCGTTSQANIDSASLHGFEAEAGYENTHLLATIGYSYVTGTNDDTGDYLNNITPHTMVADLGFKLPHFDSVVGWRTTFAAEHDAVNDAEDARDGYVVHDLYAQWAPGSMQHLRFNFGIDNLFDADYARVFAGAAETGRSIKAGLRLSW